MHYPHSPHRSNYFTVLPQRRLEGDLPLLPPVPSEASEGSHYQLYNLAEDPFESKNLAAGPAREAAKHDARLDRQHGAARCAVSGGERRPDAGEAGAAVTHELRPAAGIESTPRD